MRVYENTTYTPPKLTYSGHPVVDVGGQEFAVNKQTHTVDVNALNKQLEQQQIAYVNAKASGNKAAMDAASKNGAELRSAGANIQVSAAASALQKYYDQSGVKVAISSHNVDALNKQIVQAKNDYAWAQAHNDTAGMAAAAQAGANLRAMGGTIGVNVSLVDAKKIVNGSGKTTTPAPQTNSTNTVKQVASSAVSVAGGGIYSILNNSSLGLLHVVANDNALSSNKSYVTGKVAGDVVSAVGGIAAIVDGVTKSVGGVIGGLATSPTGIGALAGGAIAVGGVVEAGYGAGVTSTSLSNLKNDTMVLANGTGEGGRQTVTSNLGKEIDITPSAKHTTTITNPGYKGEHNTSVDIVDSKTGELKTRRWFGPDGKANRDVDFSQHGNPKQHPEAPHEHIWTYNEDGTVKSR
jgi:hypothetical protein